MSEPSDTSRLAAMQTALLETLADATDPAACQEALMVRPELAPYRAWIEGFDPRAVETGMELVRRWGIRPRQADPGQMWAYVLEEVGGPFVARQLSRPEPGPGQVRLKVRASGICGTDVHLWEGRFPVPLPIVAGHEPVGEIEALGPGVEGLALGDRVGVPWMQSGCGTCDECARDRSKYCQGMTTWMHNGGAFAEAMIVEAAGCIPIPDAVSWTAAAPLFCAGFTVMSGYRRGRPRPDDRVAVVGLGGLGHLAIQIAAAHGHEVVAITRDRTKARDAIGLGAHEVQVATDHPGQELATSGGADLILSTTNDVVAAGGMVHGLRPEGRLVAMGLGEGAMPIDPEILFVKQAQVIGAMQDARADLTDLLDLAASGAVRPRVEVYDADSLPRALHRLREGRVRYRAVLAY